VLVRGNASDPLTGTLAHNTIAQNGDQGVYVGWYDSGYAVVALINNIIVSHTTGIYSYQDPDKPELVNVVTATCTLFYGNGFDTDPYGGPVVRITDTVGVAPLFVNPAGWNYHIAGNSPAVDHGMDVPWVVTDVDSEPRPSHARYDIGADEVQWKYVHIPLVMKRHR